MRVTCSSCKTEYEVDDADIYDDGRDVQCTVCQHQWFFDKNPEISKKSKKNLALAQEEAEETQKKPTFLGRFLHHIKIITIDQRLQFIFAWLFLFAVLGSAGYITSAKYENIIQRYPQLTKLSYIVFKDQTKSLFQGLNLTRPRTYSEFIDGKRILVIEGNIENQTDQSLTIPVMRASILNQQGEEIVVWNIKYPEEKIAPNQTVSYSSRREEPPIDADVFLITFLTKTEAILGEDSVRAESIKKEPIE